MDIDLLKTFLEVQQIRHFGRAAENLFLTQAAVSARIKQLENIVGSPVFTRYRNNLQLTETGRRLVPHAQAIVIAWDRAKQEVSLDRSNDIILGVGAISGLWDLFLQDSLNESYREQQGIVWRAEAQPQDILVRRLLDRTMDVAYLYESAKHSDIKSKAVQDIDLVLVSTPGVIGSIEEALKHYVAVDWGTTFNIQFAKTFGNVPVLMHTHLSRIALNFLLINEGSAYLPYELINDYLGERFHINQDAPRICRRIYACYHEENKYEKQIRKFISLSEQQLEEQGSHE
ncbi:LysR family transcriptional regulator [Reinekea marinisedimentorum]|uniref:DNA-binding transcriptional LysR family regulator n=1 Tax=Reinekea marinisedimentorum TaxID=230495 RepID=A0A4R3IB10_9GAMM|nr:LysR family transcriptional regulator [Reinekea marinisedimentorum]TCS42699.1 DNA-binding transcriptional LysR family regulator [Reinekea marinisedimentorum]